MNWHTGLPDDTWDKAQAAHNAHFLQRHAWARVQQAFGRDTFYAHGNGWSWLALLEKGKIATRLYCPYGPTATSHKALQEALQALTDCAKQQGAMFIRVEPLSPVTPVQLFKLGLQRAHRDVQPRFTLVKHLDRPTEELELEISNTNRRVSRQSEQRGISFSASQDPQDTVHLLKLLAEVAARTGIRQHTDRYFYTLTETLLPTGHATLHFAHHENAVVAAVLSYQDEHTRYYAHAGNATAARKLQPSVSLMREVIFGAKTAGLQDFDYFGVAPPNADDDHPWTGLTKFKKSFGGEYREYLGTWELPVQRLKHRVYTTSASLYRKFR